MGTFKEFPFYIPPTILLRKSMLMEKVIKK